MQSLIRSYLTDLLQMSDGQCIIAAWSDSLLLIAMVQLVTTLSIAGLDKSLHVMSKEFRSSNCRSLLDLDFKSIHVDQAVMRKSSIRRVVKLCWRTQLNVCSTSSRQIKVFEYKRNTFCSFMITFSIQSELYGCLFPLALLRCSSGRTPVMCCLPEKMKN